MSSPYNDVSDEPYETASMKNRSYWPHHLDSHPEMLRGERLLTNSTLEDIEKMSIPIRVGKQAYDIEGEKIKGLFPVFSEKE